MQQKYELRLTYFWHKNEKKISLNLIFVFEPLRFWQTCPSFLLSKFVSQTNLIQSMVGSVASLRVLRSHFQGPGCQGLVSQGPWVPWSWVSGFQVSGPDFRLSRKNRPGKAGSRQYKKRDAALTGWNFSHVIAGYNLWRVYNTAGKTGHNFIPVS